MKKFTLISMMLILVSCEKSQFQPAAVSEITPIDNMQGQRQKELTSYLGFKEGEVTFTSDTSNKMHFKTKEDALKWLNQIRFQGTFDGDRRLKVAHKAAPLPPVYNPTIPNDGRPSDDQGFGGSTMYTASYTNWWGINGFTTSFTWGFDSNGNVVASQFDGEMVGFTLFTGYDYRSSSYTVSNNEVIHYTIYGYQTYGLTVEGFGAIVAKQPATAKGTYNTKTGKHTSTYYAN